MKGNLSNTTMIEMIDGAIELLLRVAFAKK